MRTKYRRWFNVPDQTGLGFQIKNNPAHFSDHFTFPGKINPNINFRHFTVKTDIIETDPANGKRQLRSFVPEPMTETPDIVHKEFITPQFKPIAKGLDSIRTIGISVVDELGRPVRFTGGKVSVTLKLVSRSDTP